MNILDIIPTQNSLRSYEIVQNCLAALERGERLTPILLSKMEDNVVYLHDGMHRLCSYFLFGLSELPEDSFKVKGMTYKQYADINWFVGYVTPFDLRTECRIADLYNWKNKVFAFKECVGEKAAEWYIKLNDFEYKEDRVVYSVKDVLEKAERFYSENINCL
jgi:hypothetical protein